MKKISRFLAILSSNSFNFRFSLPDYFKLGIMCIILAILLIISCFDQTRTVNQFYVSPNGSPEGEGTFDDTWDLQTALNHPDAVRPGATIWLRGGDYFGVFKSSLKGSADAPIIVRSYPGEWARINIRTNPDDPEPPSDAFSIHGEHTWFWGFEITHPPSLDEPTNSTTIGLGGIDENKGIKLINLVIHDTENNSINRGTEVYGCILYNVGSSGGDNRQRGHQLYVQNNYRNSPVIIEDNFIFNGYSHGINAYTEGGNMNGIHMIGNVIFSNGAAQTQGAREYNIIVAVNGPSHPRNILLKENMMWDNDFCPQGGQRSRVSLGRYQNNYDIKLINNYLVGSTCLYNIWKSVEMTGNTFYSMCANNDADFKHAPFNNDPFGVPDNTYLTERPTENKIFIRPNKYEKGRAHIIIYNWEGKNKVTVDVGSVIGFFKSFEVRNAQNFLANPIIRKFYFGKKIQLPMTGLEPAQPTRTGLIDDSEKTGKEFNVFVLFTSKNSRPPITD